MLLLHRKLRKSGLSLSVHRNPFAGSHRRCPCEEARKAGECHRHDVTGAFSCNAASTTTTLPVNAEDERQHRHETVCGRRENGAV
jgi:hypothetical protein